MNEPSVYNNTFSFNGTNRESEKWGWINAPLSCPLYGDADEYERPPYWTYSVYQKHPNGNWPGYVSTSFSTPNKNVHPIRFKYSDVKWNVVCVGSRGTRSTPLLRHQRFVWMVASGCNCPGSKRGYWQAWCHYRSVRRSLFPHVLDQLSRLLAAIPGIGWAITTLYGITCAIRSSASWSSTCSEFLLSAPTSAALN